MPARHPDLISYLEQLGEQYGRTLARTLAVAPAAPAPSAQRTRTKPPATVAAPALKARRGPGRPRAVRPVAENSNVVAGALVRYRQGRGTFDAEVVRVDEVTRMATLQRTADGKRVLRPLDRVYT